MLLPTSVMIFHRKRPHCFLVCVDASCPVALIDKRASSGRFSELYRRRDSTYPSGFRHAVSPLTTCTYVLRMSVSQKCKEHTLDFVARYLSEQGIVPRSGGETESRKAFVVPVPARTAGHTTRRHGFVGLGGHRTLHRTIISMYSNKHTCHRIT